MALPGGRRVFVAKSGAEAGTFLDPPRPGAGRYLAERIDDDPYYKARREDEDLLTLLAAIVPILN